MLVVASTKINQSLYQSHESEAVSDENWRGNMNNNRALWKMKPNNNILKSRYYKNELPLKMFDAKENIPEVAALEHLNNF